MIVSIIRKKSGKSSNGIDRLIIEAKEGAMTGTHILIKKLLSPS